MAFNTPFSNLFGKSPIKPIQEHMAKAHECACLLDAFFQAVVDENWKESKALHLQIKELEHEADTLKKSIRLHLPKSLMMPMPRQDLLEIIAMQDKVANCAKDIAGIMMGRKMHIPEPMKANVLEYVKAVIATSAQALKAIDELDELLEVGFRGREIQVVEKLIEELDELEHRTDVIQIEIRSQLFKIEAELPPVDVMFLYKVIDWIGELADRAQKVGSRLQLLLAQ